MGDSNAPSAGPLELASASVESFRRSIHRSATAHIVTEQNRLITAALGKATGLERPNPYDFVGRLTKNENAQGTTIFFDKSAILWVGRAETDFVNDCITIKVPYRMLGAASD